MICYYFFTVTKLSKKMSHSTSILPLIQNYFQFGLRVKASWLFIYILETY